MGFWFACILSQFNADSVLLYTKFSSLSDKDKSFIVFFQKIPEDLDCSIALKTSVEQKFLF